MTNKELQNQLSKYPDDLEIYNFALSVIRVKYDNPLEMQERKYFFEKWITNENAAIDDLGNIKNEYKEHCQLMLELSKPLEKDVLNIQFNNLNV